MGNPCLYELLQIKLKKDEDDEYFDVQSIPVKVYRNMHKKKLDELHMNISLVKVRYNRARARLW